MIPRLILAALGVGLTIAQQEYVLYTNGPGGEECGKLHRCISNATCEDVSGVHMCVCSESMAMSGNGKLQCVPKGDHNVWIQNDPHLKNFHREFASLLTPCPYRVFSLIFVPEVDTKICVELFAQNSLCRGGHYFVTKLSLSTTVYLGNDFMKQTMEFEGDVFQDVNSGSYNYTFIARSLDTTVLDKPDDVVNIATADDSRFVDYTMAVDKDALNNLLKVEIMGIGATLFFRPSSMFEDINNMELPMVPGAVFNIKRDSWKMVDTTLSHFDIASFPEGPSLKVKATELGVSKPTLVQYLMLSSSTEDVAVGFNDTICDAIHSVFESKCKTEKEKMDNLMICSSVYAEREFLECLTSKHSKEEFTVIHKEFFHRCMIALCNMDSIECENMQKEMPKITGCPLPKKIAGLNCDSISVDQVMSGPM
ncbi:hypothetical protein ElyMa_002365700 [Elysia marginata]|uniref:VWFD domain-containing protein n=1 Tax=Elysia marginata TaxID=1093978 RepID=A0AAV4GAN8_9GAST|nr:hypothetical protein ElyMa_002365700 [Elysia marginata]